MADDSYRSILNRADQFFRTTLQEQPQNFQCGKGCSVCCYGLFEISAADVPVLADGLAALKPSQRLSVVRRAQEILAETAHPDLRECSRREKKKFYERTATVACPNLDPSGACLVYEHRPLVCRTFGLPIRDGKRYLGDICQLNFGEATDGEKQAAAWNLQWEDAVGAADEYTIPEAIVMIARMRGW
ncbi:MAG: YkgJ family cysteine cluster protein [Thermoanaerobaculia bacterium]